MRFPVWPYTHAGEIPDPAEEIHLVRPLPKKRLLELVDKKKVKKVFLSKSCLSRLGEKKAKALREKGIEIIVESKRGRALGIPLDRVAEVVELHKDFQSFRKIEKLTGIPKSTAHYLVKYAVRQKIKDKNSTIYI
ncbi:MAG: hypothetical protein Q7K34_04660 [archaeon]|nr:hypothetical protein [archaeon]